MIIMPPLCPKYGRKENRITVCSHCGYRYKPSKINEVGIIFTAIFIIVFGVVLIFTGCTIIFEWIDGTPLSKALINTLKSIWNMLTNL